MFLTNGFPTLFTFSSNPTVHLKEVSVTPPGIDGGDAIDTTTMRSVLYRTMAPRVLKSLTEATFSAAYDPVCYTELNSMINVNQLMTATFPDGSTLDFWGFLRTFTPGENTEGDRPTADCGITPTNQDDTGTEVAPVYTPAP